MQQRSNREFDFANDENHVWMRICFQAAIRGRDPALPIVSPDGNLLMCPSCRFYKAPGRFGEAIQNNLKPPVCGNCVNSWCLLHKALRLGGNSFNETYAEYERVGKRNHDRR